MRGWILSLVSVLSLAAVSALAEPAKDQKTLLNFDGKPLVEVVKTMSKVTGKNFIVEQALRTRQLTVISATRVSPDEAYRAFLSALELEGLTAIEEGRFVKIVGARQPPRPPSPACDAIAPDAIRQVDATHWLLKRGAFEELSLRADCLAVQARIVPSFQDGKPNGFKLFAIRPASVYQALGIKSGDVIHKVAGFELVSPEKVQEAYAALRGARKFSLQLTRQGAARTHQYTFE